MSSRNKLVASKRNERKKNLKKVKEKRNEEQIKYEDHIISDEVTILIENTLDLSNQKIMEALEKFQMSIFLENLSCCKKFLLHCILL